MSPELSKTFDLVVDSINKKYGKGTLQSFADKPRYDPNSIVSTGSIALDAALGIGGYKKGRIIEISGKESCGKSTIALHAIANVQKAGGRCVFLDVENALDISYAESLGCDIDSLMISQTSTSEETLEIANILVKSGEVDLIVVDSVAAMVPKSELEGEIGDQTIGKQARLMSQAMRMLTANINKTNTILLLINQLRANIGAYMGPANVTTSGNAIRYYASQRLEIARIGSEKEGNDIIGNRTKVKVIKNKLSPPFKEAEFIIKFGVGIYKDQEILDLAIEDGIIKKAGAWFKYGENNDSIAQGKIKTVEWLNENPEIKENIRKEILANRGLD